MRTFTLMISMVLTVATNADAGSTCTDTELQSLPLWFSQSHRIAEPYRVSCRLNPFYLRGDFDGDGHTDLAVLVTDVRSGKHGIAVARRATEALTILGAGAPFGNGGDDFAWMDVWRVDAPPSHPNVEGQPVPEFRGELLYLEKSESASGWAGMIDSDRFVWYQGGD